MITVQVVDELVELSSETRLDRTLDAIGYATRCVMMQDRIEDEIETLKDSGCDLIKVSDVIEMLEGFIV